MSMTTLELVNRVLENAGLSTVSNLTNMTKTTKVAFDALNKYIIEVSQKDKWRPLEVSSFITLTLDEDEYALPTDFNEIRKRSFRYDNKKPIEFIDGQKFDERYVDQEATSGEPSAITIFGDYFKLNRPAGSGQVGKLIRFRYLKVPDKLVSTALTGQSWFPNGFDDSVLCALATYDLLMYREMKRAVDFWYQVWGDPERKIPGSFLEFKRVHRIKMDSEVPIIGMC